MNELLSIDVGLLSVTLAALITALATGLGALPFAFTRTFSGPLLGVFSALAGGLMLAASHSLVSAGERRDPLLVLLGMGIGVMLILLAERWIARQGSPDVSQLRGANARKALLIIGVMTAHSFAEGIGVGVSYGGGAELGLLLTLAIAIHNIPEGLAISLILVPRGMGVWKAAGWSVFSSLPQPLMAIPAFLFVTTFEPFLPVGMGIAAGAMIWLVLAEMVPDSLKEIPARWTATAFVAAFMAMFTLQLVLEH